MRAIPTPSTRRVPVPFRPGDPPILPPHGMQVDERDRSYWQRLEAAGWVTLDKDPSARDPSAASAAEAPKTSRRKR